MGTREVASRVPTGMGFSTSTVVFFSRLQTNDSVRQTGSRFGTAHHLKTWKKAHMTPCTTQAHLPKTSSCRGSTTPRHQVGLLHLQAGVEEVAE